MGARDSIIADHFKRAHSVEQRDGCPHAACPVCGRDCAVYWPRGGDGSARVTFWHKAPDGSWCRAEVDVADVRFENKEDEQCATA